MSVASTRLYYLFPTNDKSIPTCNLRFAWAKNNLLNFYPEDALFSLIKNAIQSEKCAKCIEMRTAAVHAAGEGASVPEVASADAVPSGSPSGSSDVVPGEALASTSTVSTATTPTSAYLPGRKLPPLQLLCAHEGEAAADAVTDYLRLVNKMVAFATFPEEETAAAVRSIFMSTPSLQVAVEFCGMSYLTEEGMAGLLRGPAAEHAVVVDHCGQMGLHETELSRSKRWPPVCPAFLSKPVARTVVLGVASPREAKMDLLGPAIVPGLLLIHDFISPEEEEALLQEADEKRWTKTLVRAVQHYGHGFDYITRGVLTANTDGAGTDEIDDARMPRIYQVPTTGALGNLVQTISTHGFVGDHGDDRVQHTIINKPLQHQSSLHEILPLPTGATFPTVNQITINEYLPAQGIAGHIDTHESFEDGVVSLSLGGTVVMEFVYAAKEPRDPRLKPGITKAYAALPARSLLVMRGEARYAWSHTIQARRTDFIDGIIQPRPDRRISITLRVVRQATPEHPRGDIRACPCKWKSVCKSQNVETELMSPHLQKLVKSGCPPAEPEKAADGFDHVNAPDVEKRHVHDLYNAIAPHFSSTRYAPWPAVEKFLMEQAPGSLVLDVGCGNGKYMNVNPALQVIGTDMSDGLLEICAAKGYDVFTADAVRLPFRDGIADTVLNIAVMHHISTLARRIALIHELFRIARPGAVLFVQAWAFEQGEDSKRSFDKQDVFVPWNLQTKFLTGETADHLKGTSNLAGLEAAGGSLDASKKVVVFQRYCHMYKKGELEELIQQATRPTPATILNAWWEKDNWCVLAKKSLG